MSLWAAVLVASAAAFATKYAGHIVPGHWLEGPRVSAVMSLMPVSLLAALVTVQAVLGPGGTAVVDARLAGLAVAAVALWFRAPFIVVVVLGAATAALLRAAGVP
jgi:branched-subunit amino acid transport protein